MAAASNCKSTTEQTVGAAVVASIPAGAIVTRLILAGLRSRRLEVRLALFLIDVEARLAFAPCVCAMIMLRLRHAFARPAFGSS